jgi:signal transduction histidine kinase
MFNMDDKLEKVNFLGGYLASARSEQQILDMAIHITLDILGFDHAIIRLLEGGALITKKSIGFPREAQDIIIHLDEGISGEAARTGVSILVEDTINDPRFIKGVENCRSELCVPIKYDEKTIGIFNVESEKAEFFTESDKSLLETLASQIATALAATRLREELAKTEKLSILGRMASSILHDIRNDIHHLNISSDLLSRKDVPPERVMKLASLVKKSADNIYALIEDIFEFVKTGRATLVKKEEPLAEMLEPVAEQARELGGERVEVNLSVEPGLAVPMDRRRFRRVMLNLARNAVEAMPNGGTLSIIAGHADGVVEVKVSDTGVGIPKENISKIWELLFTAGKKDGAGLGMAIVKQIIEDHGWSISVETEEGKGTTFTVRMG